MRPSFRGSYLHGLSAKILTVPITAFCLGILIPGIVGYLLLQQSAQRETADKARMLLRVFTAGPRSGESEAAGAKRPNADGDAANGATLRRTLRHYEGGDPAAPFHYRQVAPNAADPQNRPDDYENRLIGAFVKNAQLKQIEEEVQRQGGRCFVAASPIVSAPTGQGGKKGQVIGVSVLYMPSEPSHLQAAMVFLTILKIVGTLSLLCIVALIWRVHTLIVLPTRQLMATSEAIRKADWRARFTVRWPDELSDLAVSFQNTTLWLREQIAKEEKLRALFQQFVPASVAALALGIDADKVLAGTRHPVTVMIINIRNFKLLMEHLPPEETVSTLNEYFSEVNKVIVANKGLVSKYLGDSIMAIFGMPMGDQEHALHAVRAALGIPAALQNLYIRLDEGYGWELGVGVGISTGEPIVGCFGSSAHTEYTLLGDVVVEAHCLEEATKTVPEEDSILISEATYRHVMSDVYVYDVGEKPGAKGATIHAYVVQGFRSEARSALAA